MDLDAIGPTALRRGWLTAAQLDACRVERDRLRAVGPEPPDLGAHLIAAGLLTETQLDALRAEASGQAPGACVATSSAEPMSAATLKLPKPPVPRSPGSVDPGAPTLLELRPLGAAPRANPDATTLPDGPTDGFPSQSTLPASTLARASPPQGTVAPGEPADVTVAATRPENRLGAYVLVRELGRGGMGVVHQAWDRSLRRWVAVKRLPSPGGDSSDPRASGETERFLREARAAARLRHPGIVQVHEVGLQEGRSFLAMDLVRGVSLRALLALPSQEAEAVASSSSRRSESGPPPSEPARPRRARRRGLSGRLHALLSLLSDVARALDHAHAQGIIHRDLKPENILVEGEGAASEGQNAEAFPLSPAEVWEAACRGRARALLADFGLARDLASDSRLTLSGQVLGTPAYMAPEQARGQAAKADARADVFSLGCILYQAAVGRLPFEDSDVYALLRKVAEEDPLPPRRAAPSVDVDLETILLRCLDKEPARRYASARALADDLDRYLADEPIAARRMGRGEALWRFVSRRRRTVAAAAAALLLVAGTAGAGLHFRRQSDRTRFEAALTAAEDHLRAAVTARRALDRGETEAAAARALAAADRAAARRPEEPGPRAARARALLASGRDTEAGAELDRLRADHPEDAGAALERAVLRLSGLRPDVRAYLGELLSAQVLGPETAAVIRLRSRAATAGTLGLDADERAAALADLRTALSTRLEPAEARGNLAEGLRRWLEDDLAGARAFLEKGKADDVRAFQFLLGLDVLEKRGAEVDTHLREAVTADPADAEIRMLRVLTSLNRGDAAAASLDLRVLQQWAPKDPEVACLIVAFHLASEQMAEAETQARETAARFPRCVLVQMQAAYVALAVGRPHEADALMSRVVELQPERLDWLVVRARARIAAGRLREAEADLREVLRKDPSCDQALEQLALARRFLGDPDLGEELREALRVRPQSAPLLRAEGRWLAWRGEYEAALGRFRAATRAAPREFEGGLWTSECLAFLGRHEEALEAAKSLVATLPPTAVGRIIARIALAQRLAGCGRLEAAREAFDLLLAAYPSNPRCLSARGAFRLERGAWGEARADLDAALAVSPGEPVSLARRARARQGLRDLDGADEDARRALELRPALVEALRVRLDVLRMKKAWNELRDFGRDLLEVNPGHEIGFLALAQALCSKGNAAEAEAVCTRFVTALPAKGDGWFWRAEARAALGKLAEAEADLDRAIALAPSAYAAFQSRARVRCARKNFAGALADANRGVELSPSRAEAYNVRALVFAREGDWTGVVENLARVLELLPPDHRQRPEFAAQLADAEARAKQADAEADARPRDWMDALKRGESAYVRGAFPLGRKLLREGLSTFTRELEALPEAERAGYLKAPGTRHLVGRARYALAQTAAYDWRMFGAMWTADRAAAAEAGDEGRKRVKSDEEWARWCREFADEAFGHAEEALRYGGCTTRQLETEGWFHELHEDPRYAPLLAAARKTAQPGDK
ncbi:MAG: protein kinase [Planctomycetes bacterium]|nr:protein kinase [Planctomycetota bacterium]